MVAVVRKALIKLLSAYRRGVQLALLFDYDGTLAPIARHPSLAAIEPEMLNVLRRLKSQPSVTVGIVSGRGLVDLLRNARHAGTYFAGNCGIEFQMQGQRKVHGDATILLPILQKIVRSLRGLTSNYSGSWVENKQLGLSLHYREVAPDDHESLLTRARALLHEYSPYLRVIEGVLALEITPAIGCDKGTAVQTILESIGGPVMPVYAGDSANDLEGLAMASAHCGVAIGVGPEAPPSFDFRLPNPAALTRFLSILSKSLSKSCINSARPPELNAAALESSEW